MWSSYLWSRVDKINEAFAACVYHIRCIRISSWIITYSYHLSNISRLSHLSIQYFIKDYSQYDGKSFSSTEWVGEAVPSILMINILTWDSKSWMFPLSHHKIMVYGYLLYFYFLTLLFFKCCVKKLAIHSTSLREFKD